ncbi:hypothetical protein [Rugamonas aquatica]|uniref:Uncharacterized protein n=1 Tax=Rugamonas aquatica TaxID=2743357 RepID=A0A6A7N9X5_9BURK|nr:hypothetical protein [Rugamonas aquatica]MQA41728.1 hypothetical protein [Rugamonas aquatica]
MTTSRLVKLLGLVVLVACLFAGCFGTSPRKPEGIYVKTLFNGETVTEATRYGEFTRLSIEYSDGGGSYFSSGRNSYLRLIHRDKIVVKEARQIEPWPGLDTPTFFAESYVDDWREFLIHEAAGKPVVERIEQGDMSRDDTRRLTTEGFRYGYPWRQGVRYFPRAMTPGFLLSVFPMKLKVLPHLADLRYRLEAYTLAAISPDEQSFAYVDSMDAPTFVMVVDQTGERRDPIPIPRVELPPRPGADVNPYERVWSWFNATYTWQRDSNGKWAAKPVAPAQRAAANPAEEIFLSERIGYRSCFTAADAYCLTNWHQASRAEAAKAEPRDEAMPFAYAPSEPMRAFGGNVKLLVYGTSYWNNSGYLLYTDAAPGQAAAEYVKRLESRKIPFVRSDQCAKSSDGDRDCDGLLKSRLNIKSTYDDWLGKRLRNPRPGETMFVLPDLVISFLAAENGSTIIQTQYRGDLSRSQ